TAGAYQVVLAKYPQLVFRSVPQAKINAFFKKLKPYKGTPEPPAKEGKRHQRVTSSRLEQSDRLTAKYFKPEKTPRELSSYDRSNYQWREVEHAIKVETKDYRKSRPTLQKGDKIGVRYTRPSLGGYVILPSGERIQVSHDLYTEIVEKAHVMPRARQMQGVVEFSDLLPTLPRGASIRINRPTARKARDHIADVKHGKPVPMHGPLVSDFEYKDIDADIDFDDDEDEDFEFEQEEDEDDEEQHVEDDHADDVDYDDDGHPVEDEEAIYAEPGLQLKDRGGRVWVVLHSEQDGLKDTLTLFSRDKQEIRTYKVPAGEDLRTLKSVEVVGKLDEAELETVFQEASDSEA